MFLLLFPLIFLTLGSLAILTFIVTLTSPTAEGWALIPINLIYFFATSFVSVAGIITLVLYFVGSWQLRNSRQINVTSVHKPKLLLLRSARHGVLIGVAVVGIG